MVVGVFLEGGGKGGGDRDLIKGARREGLTAFFDGDFAGVTLLKVRYCYLLYLILILALIHVYFMALIDLSYISLHN